MSELLTIVFAAIFIENIVLTNFLGMCPLLGVTKKLDSAIGMGFAVVFVVFGASVITYVIHHALLLPNNLAYMDLLVFILVIASFVQLVEMFIKKASPALYKSLGIFLPLITTNCAVLFVALENIKRGYTFVEMLVYSISVPLGFMMILIIFATIRERLEAADTPVAFKGSPIALIALSIMAIAFSSLVGII